MSRFKVNKAEYKADDYKGQATDLENLQDAAPLAVAAGPEALPIDDRPAETLPSVNLGQFVQDATRPDDGSTSPLVGTSDNYARFAAAPDADMILQAMYKILPSKEIAALLRNL